MTKQKKKGIKMQRISYVDLKPTKEKISKLGGYEFKDKSLSNEDYWKKFEMDEEGNQENHEVTLDINVKFKGLNGEIFQTIEKDVSANPDSLDKFFSNLKSVIRMVDETIIDRSPMN